MIFGLCDAIIKTDLIVLSAQGDDSVIKEKLLNVFLEENTLSALTKAVSTELECPVIVADDAYHIAASCAAGEYDDPVYRVAVSHGELALEDCAAISAHCGEDDFSVEMNGRKYRVIQLESRGTVHGYMLMLYAPKVCPFSDDEIHFISALVSKQLFFERRETADGTAEEILSALFDGEFSDEEHFKIRAQATYLSNFNPERLALIDLRHCTPAAAAFLQAQMASEFHASHPFVYKDKTIMFLHGDHSMKRLSEAAEQNGIKIAVSARLNGIFSAARLYRETLEALDYLNEKGKSGLSVFAEDYAQLLFLRSALRKGTVFDSRVSEMAEYDRVNSGELCLTLYTYLCCGHSLKETCERLYTHKNTVLYRIRRIKENFGIDTDNPDLCFGFLAQAALELVKSEQDELFIRNEAHNNAE